MQLGTQEYGMPLMFTIPTLKQIPLLIDKREPIQHMKIKIIITDILPEYPMKILKF